MESQSHPPESRGDYGRRAGLTGIACNLSLFAAKLLVGTLSGSVSITADAVNNLSDASGSIVTFLGFRLAEKPADPEHPYGHARVEYVSGLVVAMFILLIGWELAKTSVTRILHPEPVEFSLVTALVLVGSIAAKLWMSLYFHRIGRLIHSPTLEAASADSRNDVISTAAVLLSGVLGYFTSWNVDAPVGLLVALFILWSGIGIARDTIDPLLGKAPDPELSRNITAELSSHPEVLGWHDLMLHDYGPGKVFGSVHVEMDMHWDPLAAHELIDRMESDCLASFGIVLSIHYDPIVTDDEDLNLLKDTVLQYLGQLDSRLTAHDFRMVRGQERSNLIFDLVVPYDRKKDAELFRREIQRAVTRVRPKFVTVITIDDTAFNSLPSKKE